MIASPSWIQRMHGAIHFTKTFSVIVKIHLHENAKPAIICPEIICPERNCCYKILLDLAWSKKNKMILVMYLKCSMFFLKNAVFWKHLTTKYCNLHFLFRFVKNFLSKNKNAFVAIFVRNKLMKESIYFCQNVNFLFF